MSSSSSILQGLYESGELSRRIADLRRIVGDCTLCPHRCRVDRTAGETGFCCTGLYGTVASAAPHFGEEPPLVGSGGSGTIFFAGCNLECVFCQNFDISCGHAGRRTKPKELAAIMLELQRRGSHNINLVSPTHVMYLIAEALPYAIEGGLRIPIVYNSGGYDSVETLEILDGIVDIYMPDMKYGNKEAGNRYSGVSDYPERCFEAVAEMHRQVGDLTTDRKGVAVRGLIVRHLVLPGDASDSEPIFRFLSGLSTGTYLNIMNQYRPEYQASGFREISRRPTLDEYDRTVELARSFGLNRLAR
jgi:putative pyruvate formate lyase activating enzyme